MARMSDIENDLIKTFLAALKKGMTADEFFAVADTTMEHLRGKTKNATIEKIMNDTATSDDVKRMVTSLNKLG